MSVLSVESELNGELITEFSDDAIHLRSNGKVVRCHLVPKKGVRKAHFDAIQLIHKSPNNRQYALGEVRNAQVIGCVVEGSGTKVQCAFGSDGVYHNITVQHNTFSTDGEHYVTLNGLISGNISSNTFIGDAAKPIKLYPARIGGNPDGEFSVWVLDLPYQLIESDQPELIQDLRQVVFNDTDKFVVDIDWVKFDRMIEEVPANGGRTMGREFQRIALECGTVVTEYQAKEVTTMMSANKGTPFEIGQLYLGQEEIKGSAEHNPYIVEFFKTTSYKATDDETPWCAAAHCYMHEQAGYAHTKSAAALSWKDWGVPIDKPVKECTIIADYGNGKGHVGFYMGETNDTYIIMGGNQGDAYCVAHYPKNAAYRWYFRKSKRAMNSKTNWTAGGGALAGTGITIPAVLEKLEPVPAVEEKPTVPPVSEQICEMQQCPVKIPEGYKAVPQEIYSVALGVGVALLAGSLFIIYERYKKIKVFGI